MDDEKPRTTDGSAGPSTDRHGNPVLDPTKNVIDLVAAANHRQDDLRIADSLAIREELEARAKVADARFIAIYREFAMIESRRVEQKVDTKIAVDAALSAAEKAVKEQTVASEKAIIKSETSAAEQSKQQNATFTAALKGVSDILADVKDRVVKIESRKEGARETTTDQRADKALVWQTIAVLVAVMAIVITLAVATHGFS